MIVNPALEFFSLTVSCFEVALDEMLAELERVLADFGFVVSRETRPLVYESFGPDPLRGGHGSRRIGLLSRPTATRPATVVITNMMDGWLTLAHVVSMRLQCRCFRFTVCRADVERYPRNALEVIDRGESARTVGAMRDGDRWAFQDQGAPLDVEDVSLYRKRMIKQRVTRDSILAIARRCGFAIADDAFWRPDDSNVFIAEGPHQFRA